MTQISDADMIRQKMRRIRHKMDDDVEGIVHNASQLMSYQFYITHYPLATLAAVSTLAYLLVPSARGNRSTEGKFQIDAKQLEDIISKKGIVVETKPASEASSSWRSNVFGWVTRTALNAALAYGTVYLDQTINKMVSTTTEKSLKS